VFDPKSPETYVNFVLERERVRISKESGQPAPWTADPVLSSAKFTNVRRRDDRVSKWVIEHLIEPAVGDGDPHLWFTLLVARMVNWPPTIQRLMDAGVIPCSPADFSAAEFGRVIEEARGDGLKAFSGAYTIYPTRKEPGANKSRTVGLYILGGAVGRALDVQATVLGDGRTVADVVGELSKCFGVSTFMAGQVAADLTYTGLEFSDLYTWAPIGPGSKRGLNFLYGRPMGFGWKQEEFNCALMKARDWLVEADPALSDMTLHDVQSTFCEYSKYCKINQGGKVTRRYNPELEF
jgi:hypothetical protein